MKLKAQWRLLNIDAVPQLLSTNAMVILHQISATQLSSHRHILLIYFILQTRIIIGQIIILQKLSKYAWRHILQLLMIKFGELVTEFSD